MKIEEKKMMIKLGNLNNYLMKKEERVWQTKEKLKSLKGFQVKE